MGNQLDILAKGPSSILLKYQGYEINGFIFYTKKQDGKSTYQNSCVHFDAHDENGDVLWFHREDMRARLWSVEGSSFSLPLGLA